MPPVHQARFRSDLSVLRGFLDTSTQFLSPIAGPWYPISGILLSSSNSIARSAIPHSSPGTRGTFLEPISAHQAAKEKKKQRKEEQGGERETVSCKRRLGVEGREIGKHGFIDNTVSSGKGDAAIPRASKASARAHPRKHQPKTLHVGIPHVATPIPHPPPRASEPNAIACTISPIP